MNSFPTFVLLHSLPAETLQSADKLFRFLCENSGRIQFERNKTILSPQAPIVFVEAKIV